MCFVNYYDWHAEVSESTEVTVQKVCKCDSCRDELEPGDAARHIYLQEYEFCKDCDDEDDFYCEHSYGNEEEYLVCMRCEAFRKSIVKVEEEKGCPPSEREPPVVIFEELSEHDVQNVKEYADRFIADHPEHQEWIKKKLWRVFEG